MEEEDEIWLDVADMLEILSELMAKLVGGRTRRWFLLSAATCSSDGSSSEAEKWLIF